MSINKTITVDKFLGLRESSDGSTELKLGEAAVMENFYITDDNNLKTRPGTMPHSGLLGGTIHTLQTVNLNNTQLVLTLYEDAETPGSLAYKLTSPDGTSQASMSGAATKLRSDYPVKIFAIQNKCYLVGGYLGGSGYTAHVLAFDYYYAQPLTNMLYVPLILSGCAPAGGGTEVEPVNILSDYVRIQFSADGVSNTFQLPSNIRDIAEVYIDNEKKTREDGTIAGAYDSTTHVYTYATPSEGINNVELVCVIDDDYNDAREKFLKMRHCEAFNGATDTRFFFYGDGTNVCYYTGTPAHGTGLYIPAGNEIAVDASSSPITGMRRHYTRLMAFKPDGAFTIDYDPVTLEDGSVIAGFYVRPASRSVGNQMDDQIQTVNNYPRTLCNGVLYEWRHTAAYYQDERYAKQISEKVSGTLMAADPSKIVTCDDDANRTYYMFLNDDRGTVLLHRYELDAWCIYTGDAFKNVTGAVCASGQVFFSSGTQVLKLYGTGAYDELYVDKIKTQIPITARWESGYNPFSVDYKRKYSSYLWISMKPEVGSSMNVTVKTDRRDAYITKTLGNNLFTWDRMDFSNFSFLLSTAPRIRRIKLKVKKFVYYKLIFTVDHPGARATILSYDQQIRCASNVK